MQRAALVIGARCVGQCTALRFSVDDGGRDGVVWRLFLGAACYDWGRVLEVLLGRFGNPSQTRNWDRSEGFLLYSNPVFLSFTSLYPSGSERLLLPV